MSAGVPDWQKLHQMGKLPQSARGNVPILAQLDTAEREIKRLMDGMCAECKVKLFGKDQKPSEEKETVQLQCPHCPAMVGGKGESVAKMNLGKHVKSAHPEIGK